MGLVTSRQTQSDFKHVFVTNRIVEFNLTGTAGKYGSGYLFPLYLYPDPDKKDLFSQIEETKGKQPNISKNVFSALSKVYKKEPSPEEIFYYIYAVLCSNAYRTKYAEFLRTDFPRVPFTNDYELFWKMGKYGRYLVDLHLLRSSELDPPIAKFQGKGTDRVEKLRYDKKKLRVYINKDQYFEGVAQEIWEYQIGGYQVCSKWLKDRIRKAPLSTNDIKHYCKVTTAIKKTLEFQRSIDAIYSEVGKKMVPRCFVWVNLSFKTKMLRAVMINFARKDSCKWFLIFCSYYRNLLTILMKYCLVFPSPLMINVY